MTRLPIAAVVLVACVEYARSFVSAPSINEITRRPTVCCEASSKGNPNKEEPKSQGGFFRAIGGFFEELDAFMDDASARRLGNGAAFYGKRRSNFYGEKDKNKKRDRAVFDPTEDYQGPSSSGFFKWMPDEDGQMRPVTRMKNRVIEKRSWFSGSSNDE